MKNHELFIIFVLGGIFLPSLSRDLGSPESRGEPASGEAWAGELPAMPSLPPVLSLEEALRLFRTHGLDLLIAEAAVKNAEGDVKVAGGIPNPWVNISWQYAFGYDEQLVCPNNCQDNGFTVVLSDQNAIEEELSGKRALRLKVARAALSAARMARVDAQRTLEVQVKQQYIQTVLSERSLSFAKEVQDSAQKTADLTKLRYKNGAVSEIDWARAETAALEASQQVDSAELALGVAKAGLVFLLGLRGQVPDFDILPETLRYRLPAALAGATADSLLQTAFAERPDLRAQEFQRQRAEASITLTQRNRVPDIALQLGYTQQGTGDQAVQPPTTTLGLIAVLPVLYQRQGELLKARADSRQQDVQYAKQQAQLTQDVAVGYRTFSVSQLLVQRMESQLLQRAKHARDLVEFRYKDGAASFLEYLDAQRTYIATHIEYLQDLANYWSAVYQLEAAVGRDLR